MDTPYFIMVACKEGHKPNILGVAFNLKGELIFNCQCPICDETFLASFDFLEAYSEKTKGKEN